MLRCPKCRQAFADKRYCPRDGLPLVELDASAPRGRADLVGSVVGGKYRILARIGEGGMGEVYKVEHVALGKLMAMKILHRDLSAHEQAVLRFEQEARSASALDHPHIIFVSDFGMASDGSLYIVMEFLVGLDLFDELKEIRHMSPERTVHVMRQVCSGLAEAHRRGVIHRDLKPENIFLARDREFPDFVKILDFGIAKVLEGNPAARTLTGSGTVFGTPEYLSPEQAAAAEIDCRADIYSLGIIMYRMVAGRLPFSGGSKNSLIQRQLHEMPQPFSERQMPQEVPEDLERIIFRLLAKDPDDRYQSAEQLKLALERADLRTAEERAHSERDAQPINWIVFQEDERPAGMPPRNPQASDAAPRRATSGRVSAPPRSARGLSLPAEAGFALGRGPAGGEPDLPRGSRLGQILPLGLAGLLLLGLLGFWLAYLLRG